AVHAGQLRPVPGPQAEAGRVGAMRGLRPGRGFPGVLPGRRGPRAGGQGVGRGPGREQVRQAERSTEAIRSMEAQVPEFGLLDLDADTVAGRIGLALGLTFQSTGSREESGPWSCWEGQGSRVVIASNVAFREALGGDFDRVEYYEAQALRFPVS